MDGSFRIAFCIECHKYTPVLQELCRLLQHPDHTIFIHADRKAQLRDFAPLKNTAHLLTQRAKVYWGQFGQIEAMLNLFDATRQGDFRYIVLLSGDTLPLRSCGEIREYLLRSYPMQFIHRQPELDVRELRFKMRRMHYYDKTTVARSVARKYCKWFRPQTNRLFSQLPPLEKGSNWIIATDKFRDFVFDYIRTHPEYLRAFRHSHCGDEIFFQTLLGISDFAATNSGKPIMYTEWNAGGGAVPHPETFGTADLTRLLGVRDEVSDFPFLFARKFDDRTDIETYRSVFFPQTDE